MSDQLEIHFIGGGFGESVAIRFPDNSWGIVDAYTHSADDARQNPTWCFLEEKSVTDIRFLCMSHPHEDHYTGLRQILSHTGWRVREFWHPAAPPHQIIKRYAERLYIWRMKQGLKDALASAEELFRLYEEVRRLGLPVRRIAHQFDQPSTPLCEVPGSSGVVCRVGSFAPGDALLEGYEELLRTSGDPEKIFHRTNDLSIGLHLNYGEVDVLLAADMTQASWTESSHRLPKERPVSLLKAAHHGSTNGFVAEMHQQLLSPDKTQVLIFPFHRYRLPRTAGLSFYRSASAQVMLTVPLTEAAKPPGRSSNPAGSTGMLAANAFSIRRVSRRPLRPSRWQINMTPDGRLESIPEGDAALAS